MYSLQPTAAAPMHLGDGLLERTGGTIGRYELLQPLGGGELGLVFAGRHKVLRKRVAIKVLPPELADSALVPARFLRDAQVASQLDHENIISVTDFGRDRLGNLYMVMELLAGRTLRDELADNPVGMSLERALPILRQLCRAVSFAHKAGVVHRDICPKNIFVGEHGGKKDFVKLADFGMSYVAGRAEEDVAVATTPYVSPEQLRGEGDQDHRVDVYAIGVLAFELLTGTLPFRSDDARELAAQKLSWEPLRLTHTQLGDSYPQLARLIAECLSADRDQRPATVVELEQRLASCDGGAATEVEDLAGLRAGSYRLEKLLGRGGLGSVWLAAHPVIGSRVAIKVLHSQVCESEDAVNRLVLEAQAVNRIDSPNIVKIFDFGKLDDGRDYAVMELLEGETLAARLRRLKRMRWEEVGDLAIQVSEALVVAHRAGVVHRDLKPENVFLCGDPQAPLVKLLDFGIAELVDDGVGGSSPSKRWFALGTPLYVAPEQAAGEPVGPSADVYALGAMLYELLTGQAPFVGTVSEVLTAKMTSRASSIAERCPELDPTVAQLIDGALAMNPEDRPVSLRVLQTLYEAAPPPSGEWSVSGEAPIRPSSSWRRPGSGLIGIARMPSGEWVQQHRPATPGGVSSGSGEWARAPQPAVAPHVVEPHVVEPHVVEPSQPQAQEATARDATPMMPPSAAPPPVPSALPVLAAEEEGSAPVAAVLPRVPRLRTPVGLPAPSSVSGARVATTAGAASEQEPSAALAAREAMIAAQSAAAGASAAAPMTDLEMLSVPRRGRVGLIVAIVAAVLLVGGAAAGALVYLWPKGEVPAEPVVATRVVTPPVEPKSNAKPKAKSEAKKAVEPGVEAKVRLELKTAPEDEGESGGDVKAPEPKVAPKLAPKSAPERKVIKKTKKRRRRRRRNPASDWKDPYS